MLIELSAQLEASLEILLKKDAFIACIKNLALGVQEGKHIVTGPLSLLSKLVSANQIPGDTRALFRIIKNKRSESELIKKNIQMYVVVSPEPTSEKFDYRNANQVYTVSYEWFSNSIRIQSARLLCENIDDAKIYTHMTEAYLWSKSPKMNGVTISFRPSGCGGTGIADRLKESISSEGASLCIADSDRKWPGGPLGDTAKCLRNAAKEIENDVTVAGIIILSCHEVENIIPPRLVLESIPANANKEVRLKFNNLKQAKLLGTSSDNWYFDLKEGLCQFDLNNGQNEQQKSFLSAISSQSRAVRLKVSAKCSDAPTCSKRDECSCVLIHGVSDTMLDMIVKFLEKVTPQKLAELTFLGERPSSYDYWIELCATLFSWGCAFKQIRV